MEYLKLLAKTYKTEQDVEAEIVNLLAIQNLPKGTDYFMSDIHGEYEAFCHIMNNCSGVIREKVHLWLGDQLTEAQADELCTLIYYPDVIIRQMHISPMPLMNRRLVQRHGEFTVLEQLFRSSDSVTL